ncbi:putative sugar kinase YdjH [Anaerohalosphaera lusitana]|uniref:Putative sugar kinase YdjH n=1 Tax=Anaerohalosphaera lusitana TaxID=1936003 RepID=A0A1U9NLI6_9BACT|nr:PfkB family carbohydrate kinase [Anaerohalosphaera lusitana]AQT68356.1 putative sugar kinase YdjH [Anaerohalosphaera lusitana]
MSLLVTGSIGIDTVTTPFGVSEGCIGGSAVYFSMAASYFAPVRFLGVIGDDCPFDLRDAFRDKTVDLTGLETRPGSKTFRWKGSYHGDMNEANTEDVKLNVLGERPPLFPDTYRDTKYVFLANTAPSLQMELLENIDHPQFVAADTMNLWIENEREDLLELLDKIDMLILNEGEARLLTGQKNLVTAAQDILKMGPRVSIIKKGEHGSLMVDSNGDCFMLPAYPTTVVIDPTGAGDAFAGALMGYLAKIGKIDVMSIRNAMVYGTVAASFAIGDFSIHGIKAVELSRIEDRFDFLRKVTQF